MTAIQLVRDPTEVRRIPPVTIWAVVGVGFLAVAGWSTAAWILGGDAYPVVSTAGPDRVPGSTKVLAWVLQVLSAIVGVGVLVHLARRTARERKLSFDATVAIGFVTTYWMDTLVNFYRPVLLFNSYLVNLGSWDGHIPGWISPNGREMPAPLVFTAPLYVWAFMGSGILACRLMRWSQVRRGGAGVNRLQLFVVGLVPVALIDLVLEVVFIRSGLYAYSAVVSELSLFAGTRNQFPLYEAVLVGAIGATTGLLRFTVDDRGRASIERGLDGRRRSDRGRNVVRTLAFVGFVQAVYFAANVGFIVLSFYVDATPDMPSYLTNGICGEGADYPCPGPGVPVFLPDTPKVLQP